MPLEGFIITVYCLVEEIFSTVLTDQPLRARGFGPKLTDIGGITMEIVGEFLGIDTDKGIWTYFTAHWPNWFPALGSRVNFAKQSSNLWQIKQRIQTEMSNKSGPYGSITYG